MPSKLIIAAAWFVLFSVRLVFGEGNQDWRAWRGPLGNGSIEQGAYPVQFGADNYRWRADLPGKGCSTPILLGDIWRQRHEDLMVVSPDVGGVLRARAAAKLLEADLAIIDKRRPRPNGASGWHSVVALATLVIARQRVPVPGSHGALWAQ